MNNLPELEMLTKILNAQIKSLVVLKIIAKNTSNDPNFNIDEEISKEYANTASAFTKTFLEVQE